jgi:hypothetical protein
MRNQLTAAIVFVCLTGTAAAQPPPPAPLQTPNPTYATVDMEIDVNRPAADVWKRIGNIRFEANYITKTFPAGTEFSNSKRSEIIFRTQLIF